MDKAFAVFSIVVLLLAAMFVVQHNATGEVTAQVGVNVACLVAISLPVSVADFGQIGQSASDNTTDNIPPPFEIQNDGSAIADVTIARANTSTPLFNGTGGGDNSSSFQFKARDPNATSFNASASIISFTPVPGAAPLTFIRQFRFVSGHKVADVDLLINVPFDEPPGEKSELLDFVAIQSNGTTCGVDIIPSQAACLQFDLSQAKVVGPGTKELGVKVSNNCSFPITIVQADITWTASAGIESAKIDGTTVWSDACGWGCSPTGVQPSGTLLDFGSQDKTISGGGPKQTQLNFNETVAGATFNIQFVMADNSSAFSGAFIPA